MHIRILSFQLPFVRMVISPSPTPVTSSIARVASSGVMARCEGQVMRRSSGPISSAAKTETPVTLSGLDVSVSVPSGSGGGAYLPGSLWRGGPCRPMLGASRAWCVRRRGGLTCWVMPMKFR